MLPALLLAGLVSTAGGIMTHGIYFLARTVWSFDDAKNLWLAVALFLPYIPAALLAGRVSRRLGARRTLHLVNLMMVAAGGVLAMHPPELGLWLAAPLYNTAAGMMWPLIEGYVAGGRSGPELHRAIGRFNLTWSLTLVPALWIVGGLSFSATFASLLVMHAVAAATIQRLPAAPPSEHASAPEPPGPAYAALLRASRVLLPVSYVLLDALSPLLPGVWARLGVDAAIAPVLSSTWMFARFLVFALLVRWSGWRGRSIALFVGAAALLAGFAAALSGGAAPLVLAGLVAFGAGQGTLYYGALYYGMAVGKGEVDSGGHHEAVIGVGYLAGPALGLMGLALAIPPVHAVGAVATLGLMAGLGPELMRARRERVASTS
jgi:hypothetical protein